MFFIKKAILFFAILIIIMVYIKSEKIDTIIIPEKSQILGGIIFFILAFVNIIKHFT